MLLSGISLYCTEMRNTILCLGRFVLLFCILFGIAGCGEFVGTKDDEPDTGSIDEVRISMPYEDVQWFFRSMTDNFYTPCTLEKGKWRGDAVIKVRGDTSRRYPKKSFGLKIEGRKYMLERGQEDGGLYNRIALRAYQLAGVSACDTESVGLFLNSSYLGCYNFITYYDSSTMDGELYKCVFSDYDHMENNHPLRSHSDKKFPDDDDFSNLEHLIAALTTFSDENWRQFVLDNVDIEEIASYLVVHDFLTVTDTLGSNFYIQYDGKYRLIPWDNERCLLEKRSSYKLCSDNQLIRRLAAVPEVKNAYNQKMQELFTGGGNSCILDTLQAEAADMFDNLAVAMESDPEFGTSRQNFMKIKTFVINYLDKTNGRAADGDKLILH